MHGTVSSVALITLLLVFGGRGRKDGLKGGKHIAWNCKQGNSDHIAVSWLVLVKRRGDKCGSTVHGTVSSPSVIILLLVVVWV